jgi:hydrogenase maturation protease
MPTLPTLVIGIGNDVRGDDAAGLAAARALAGRVPPGVEVIESTGDAAQLIESWAGASEVVVIDAMRAGLAPGERVRLEIRAGEPGQADLLECWLSSHGLGLATAVRLGRALGRLPDRLCIHGVELAGTEWGEGLSPAVAHGVDEVVEEILAGW